MTIINIRGTHGSGKSTIVKTLIDRYNALPVGDVFNKKSLGYVLTLSWLDHDVYVVGSYETACGGCDAIQPYADIWPRVEHYAAMGHVLFEGALVSSSYGNIGRSSEAYGNDFVFAFLDTPLSVCLERIAARRRARGDERPVDPKNTAFKHAACLKSIPKIRDEFKRRVVVVDHRKAVAQILGLLLNGERSTKTV